MNSPLVEEFKRSWVTSVIGFLLLSFGIWLLIWNEGIAVQTAHTLDEAFSNVISLNPYDRIKPEYEGRLIHITGELNIEEPLTEPDYGISVQAVKLKRRVQMYQWVEETTERNFGDTVTEQTETIYSYITEWRDKLVDSNSFYIRTGHHNPKEIPLKTHTYIAPIVKIGHMAIELELKNLFTDYVEVTSDERPERRDVKLHLGIYYHCNDVWNPEVGDIRVQFYYAGHMGDTISIVAQQRQGTLVPFYTTKNHKILLLRQGQMSVTEMFRKEHSDSRWQTWKIRALGWFLLFAATNCLARLIHIILSHLPLLNRMISNEVTTSANVAYSFSVSLTVISVAWILYRPALGAGLLMAAISPFMYCAMGVYNGAHNNGNQYNRL
ncbi:uncharacterized protein CBL_06382 [Carabus blaptoides fortunei]